MKRHDSIRDALCQALERIPGVQATREPRVENPQDGGDQRRGDIKVHKDGTVWVVDVSVVCPGTARYVGEGAATVPGTAAAVYEGVKMDKYSDQSRSWHRSRASSTRRTARWRGWWASSVTTGLALGLLLLFFLWMMN